MHKILPGLLILCGLLATQSGCASVHPYFSDRWNDAKDVTTLTLGVGIGAKARVGPIWTGLLANRDLVGLRYGCAGEWSDEELIWELAALCYGYDRFDPLSEGSDRRCDYSGFSWIPFCSFLGTGCEWIQSVRPDTLKYYCEVEAVVGLGLSIRAGLNPAELLDFLCGWFLLDICHDDIGLPRRRDE